ncbi:hypothetical protein [Enterococcus sp. 5B3_DIV0040]|uniref:hypothetical protein n=1 Tax=Enterococcus sp. 5B3_DIV0040 TaxID=1834182 RepID=UPI000A334DFE|nr:hypothetical protein [Enterococcus sp. 5B3_DIV0040]OTO02264.1 hypothetical protein A5883_003091 [Enterococcus sp. 5B3_DIV0040]
MNKKYELTNETIEVKGRLLRRIRAVRAFGTVEAGALGGFVEGEKNLSQEGSCWLYDEAKVYEDACVLHDARIYDQAHVYGQAMVAEQVQIHDDARIYDQARVSGQAHVFGDAQVYSYARVYGEAIVYDDAQVCGCAEVCEEAVISEAAILYGYVSARGKMQVSGDTEWYLWPNNC